ncbi:unnamed protein product [Lepeophtheirus salmonis]|uniref:(salmon louse) hypothetical protein n=1 Tax=Lepeophtheirus salmonis TaxID=72036 RepID=A0A7R8CYN5_LEPSM|nr:unnamed protein product [Lepeophtheirus salmonis]CAF2970699.1 unnamed protein product [Lepeophtheirus salmonis]
MDYLTRLEELLPTPYFDKCVTNATTAEVNVWLKKACYGAKTLYKKYIHKILHLLETKKNVRSLQKKDGSSSKVTCRNAGKCVKAPGILCKACIKFACEGENDIQKFDLMETKEDCVIRKKCRKKKGVEERKSVVRNVTRMRNVQKFVKPSKSVEKENVEKSRNAIKNGMGSYKLVRLHLHIFIFVDINK